MSRVTQKSLIFTISSLSYRTTIVAGMLHCGLNKNRGKYC